LAQAGAHDIVLVAGKGHEPYQEVAGVKHPFDDTAVAARMAAAGGVRRMKRCLCPCLHAWAGGELQGDDVVVDR
jgi:hypothetical protein